MIILNFNVLEYNHFTIKFISNWPEIFQLFNRSRENSIKNSFNNYPYFANLILFVSCFLEEEAGVVENKS